MEMENLKATELTLGLPGRRDHESECKNNKRSISEMDHGSSQTQQSPPKAQVVGWPPVRSYRKKAVQRSESEGSGFVKVSMDGAPYLRKIELKFYKNYFDLVKGLESMFKCNIGSELAPTYEDKDGDWMLVGDVPWDMFISSCKRLRLMKGGSV